MSPRHRDKAFSNISSTLFLIYYLSLPSPLLFWFLFLLFCFISLMKWHCYSYLHPSHSSCSTNAWASECFCSSFLLSFALLFPHTSPFLLRGNSAHQVTTLDPSRTLHKNFAPAPVSVVVFITPTFPLVYPSFLVSIPKLTLPSICSMEHGHEKLICPKRQKKSIATLFHLNVLPGISQSLWNLIFQSLSCASKNLQQQVENAVLFKCLTRELISLLSQPKTFHGDTLAKCSPACLANIQDRVLFT